MIKLIAVEPQDAYKLLLRFSDGRWGVYDFGHVVDAATEMTAPLRDPTYFGSHFIEAGARAWPNGFDLSAGSLYKRLQDEGQLRRSSKVA